MSDRYYLDSVTIQHCRLHYTCWPDRPIRSAQTPRLDAYFGGTAETIDKQH
jgi:hypothetical protein